jgi:hypothetical protein
MNSLCVSAVETVLEAAPGHYCHMGSPGDKDSLLFGGLDNQVFAFAWFLPKHQAPLGSELGSRAVIACMSAVLNQDATHDPGGGSGAAGEGSRTVGPGVTAQSDCQSDPSVLPGGMRRW